MILLQADPPHYLLWSVSADHKNEGREVDTLVFAVHRTTEREDSTAKSLPCKYEATSLNPKLHLQKAKCDLAFFLPCLGGLETAGLVKPTGQRSWPVRKAIG